MILRCDLSSLLGDNLHSLFHSFLVTQKFIVKSDQKSAQAHISSLLFVYVASSIFWLLNPLNRTKVWLRFFFFNDIRTNERRSKEWQTRLKSVFLVYSVLFEILSRFDCKNDVIRKIDDYSRCFWSGM